MPHECWIFVLQQIKFAFMSCHSVFGFLTLLSLSFSLISSHIVLFYFILFYYIYIYIFKYLCFEFEKKNQTIWLGLLHFLISLWLSSFLFLFSFCTMCKPFLFCVKKCIFYEAIFGSLTPNSFSSLFYGCQGEYKE